MRRLLLSILLLPGVIEAQQVKPAWETQPTYWDSGAYAYDGAGNIRKIGTDTYVYDALGRLKSATAITPSYPDNQQTFEYDAYGNMLSARTMSAGHESVSAFLVNGSKNQLSTTGTCPPDSLCFTGVYDAAGNQVGAIPGVVDYKWDSLGMMSESDLATRPEEYVYDANDERVVSILKPGGPQRFTLRGSDNKVAREITRNPADGTWSWSRDYVYRDGALFAAFVAGEPGPGPHRHYHLDHLGTPRLITDSAGYKLSVHTYWAFGAEAPGSEVDNAERMRFTGHEYDSNPAAPGGDLYYMHARYYGQTRARFLSVDPVFDVAIHQPQSWNKYAYSRNSPLNFIDPTGRCTYIPCVNFGHVEQEITVSAPLPPEDTWEYIIEGLTPGVQQWYADAAQKQARYLSPIGAIPPTGIELAIAWPLAGMLGGAGTAAVASEVTNPVPTTMARVIAGEGPYATLGIAGAEDVFVTAAEDIAGMSAKQLGPRLWIEPSDTFTVIEFPTPLSGVASPVFRNIAGFVGRGRTLGLAREFVIPNGPIPANSIIRIVH